MRQYLVAVALAASFTSSAFAPDQDLACFLATGFRACFPASETALFVNTYGTGVVAASAVATQEKPFSHFLDVLRSWLHEAMRAVSPPNEESLAGYGNPVRSEGEWVLFPGPSEALRATVRAFVRAAFAAPDSERSIRDDGVNAVLVWTRTFPLPLPDGSVAQIPGGTIEIHYGEKSSVPGTDDIQYVRIVYPRLTEKHRYQLRMHFQDLYALATNPQRSLQERENAAYDLSWWILATVYFEKGSTSLGKGSLAALTGHTFPVVGTFDDIDLVAYRTSRLEFRRELEQRFGRGACGSCSCVLR